MTEDRQNRTASLAIVDEPTAVRPFPGFDHLCESYSETVYQAALRVTGNGADAEDVLAGRETCGATDQPIERPRLWR
jgi:hypothetical protein